MYVCTKNVDRVVVAHLKNMSIFSPSINDSGSGFGASTEARRFLVFGSESRFEILDHKDPRCAALVQWYVADGYLHFAPDLAASKEAVTSAAKGTDLVDVRMTATQRAADQHTTKALGASSAADMGDLQF